MSEAVEMTIGMLGDVVERKEIARGGRKEDVVDTGAIGCQS
jgi:hypothetical protein